jgi:hypothetical protein
MLSEPPGADPHAGWCGRGQGEPGLYPIWSDGGEETPGRKAGTGASPATPRRAGGRPRDRARHSCIGVSPEKVGSLGEAGDRGLVAEG